MSTVKMIPAPPDKYLLGKRGHGGFKVVAFLIDEASAETCVMVAYGGWLKIFTEDDGLELHYVGDQ
jgi:hypothetical protein